MDDLFWPAAPNPGLWPHVVVVNPRYVTSKAGDDAPAPEVSAWLHEHAGDWRLSQRREFVTGSGLHSLSVKFHRQAHFMDADTALAFKLRFA